MRRWSDLRERRIEQHIYYAVRTLKLMNRVFVCSNYEYFKNLFKQTSVRFILKMMMMMIIISHLLFLQVPSNSSNMQFISYHYKLK
jgi:hypothetical protein